jgi:endonuclease YncB( thermonuclease family)
MYSTPSHLRKLYRYELVKAQKNKIGLWSEPNPEKPQDYRRREICRGEN